MSQRILVAFDFDHTILEDNSDVVAKNLIPSSEIPKSTKETQGKWLLPWKNMLVTLSYSCCLKLQKLVNRLSLWRNRFFIGAFERKSLNCIALKRQQLDKILLIRTLEVLWECFADPDLYSTLATCYYTLIYGNRMRFETTLLHYLFQCWEMYRKMDWIDYMERIFEHLHQAGITSVQIKKAIENIAPVPGMLTLLNYLKRPEYEVIIISDSNSIFISTWLEKEKLTGVVNHVYTNPAEFDLAGRLHVTKYHIQDWCKISSVNMCKGYILENHVKLKKEHGDIFSHIVYVGDGHNDFCPSLRLSESDYVFARAGFSLETLVNGNSEYGTVKAKIHVWKSGDDILNVFKSEAVADR